MDDFVIENDCLKRYEGSKEVKELELPWGILRIEDDVFADLPFLEKLVFPEGMKRIPYGSARNCKSLKEVIIPDSVKAIDYRAFQGCINLRKVVLPPHLQEIGSYAFMNCESLTEIFIPASVRGISENAFQSCKKLTRITVSPKNQWYYDADGILMWRRTERVVFYPSANPNTVYIMPEGTEIVHEGIFKMCQALKEVYLADSVTTIRDEAFWNCNRLYHIYIPKGVQEIGDNALHGTPFLENSRDKFVIFGNGILFKYNDTEETVIVPDGVTEIKPMAFFGCKTIKAIILPETVKKIKDNTFNTCTNLREIAIMHPNGNMFIWNLETLRVRKHIERALVMVQQRNFDMDALETYNMKYVMPEVRFSCILDYYLDTDDAEAGQYISDHFKDFVCQFIMDGDAFHLERFIEKTPYITAENIDTFINYAIDCTQKGGSLELQMYLMDYKATHFGFADPEDFFRL